MHKKGLTQAEIGLTQPENRPNSNFRRVVACTLQESAEKKPWLCVKGRREHVINSPLFSI